MKKMLLAALLSSLIFNISCNNNKKKPDRPEGSEKDKIELTRQARWTNSLDDAVIVLDRPSSDGHKIAVVPNGEIVFIVAETGEDFFIQYYKGKWTELEWEDKRGWAYGGYLTSNRISTT